MAEELDYVELEGDELAKMDGVEAPKGLEEEPEVEGQGRSIRTRCNRCGADNTVDSSWPAYTCWNCRGPNYKRR